MPRYYFDVMVGETLVPDEVGQEFASDYSAVTEAALLADEFKASCLDPEHPNWTAGQVIVRNGAGREVARTSFCDDDDGPLRASSR